MMHACMTLHICAGNEVVQFPLCEQNALACACMCRGAGVTLPGKPPAASELTRVRRMSARYLKLTWCCVAKR